MTVPTDLWDTHKITPGGEDGARLGRIINGNDGIAAEPGLALALLQGNASPQQAQAINQFVGALNAEKMVRAAGAAGRKVLLSQDQKFALQQMGIDYSPVEYTPQSALATLKSQMAAQGKQPVLDPKTGQPKVNKDGNVLSEALVPAGDVLQVVGPKHHVSGDGWFDSAGSLFHHLTHNPVTNVAGNFVQHGAYSTDDPNGANNAAAGLNPNGGIGTTGDALQAGYQYVSTTTSEIGSANRAGKLPDLYSSDDADLAKRLGYDPGSFFSMQAFKARGYAHGSTGALANAWDVANPKGLFGLDGTTAVTEAEVYAADPEKYRVALETNPANFVKAPDGSQALTQEAAGKLQAISSKQFQDLVSRVNAAKADIGTDMARGIGIDPVKHPDLFATTAAATNFAAAVLTDPLAAGLGAVRAQKIASVAMKNIADPNDIRRLYLGPLTSMAQATGRAQLKYVLSESQNLAAATAAGDTVEAARITARASAASPQLAGLMGDFSGENQILRMMTPSEEADRKFGQLPFIIGRGEPITTYDGAVEYLASKGGMLRLQGGYAPTETAVMPGAMSSWGYLKLRGNVAAWSTGRTAAKAERLGDKYVQWATADPGRLKTLLDEKMLLRTVPAEDDAVDALTGKTLAGDYTITMKGSGEVRGNRLRYGKTIAPEQKTDRAVAAYMLGTAKRAGLAVQRFANWTATNQRIDITTASSADDIGKVARTYLTAGDANIIKARYIMGDGDSRRAIVRGLQDQLAHASGMTRTKAGREAYDDWRARENTYSPLGADILDDNGVPVALIPGQLETEFTLPNFGAMHKAAAKIGLYEGTVGRAINSSLAQFLVGRWRAFLLMSGVTPARANLETWINLHFNGMFKDGLAAKAILRDTGKLAVPGLDRSRGMDKVLSVAPLQMAGRVYRHVMGEQVPTDFAQAVRDLPDDILQRIMHEQSVGHYALEVDPSGAGEATRIAAEGLTPKAITYSTKDGMREILNRKTGYKVQDTESLTDELGAVGTANVYEHQLGVWVNRAPDVARAMIDRIENPELGPEGVIKALESGAAKNIMAQSAFGKKFEQFDGTWVKATTPAEIALGKQQWADKITNEFAYLTTGRNGVPQKAITDFIKKYGKSPDSEFLLRHVTGMDRPAQLVKPIYVAVEKSGLSSGVESFMDMEGRLYRWFVERLIQRHSTAPAFATAYGHAKVGLESVKQAFIKGGLSEEAAERATADIAAHQGWARIARAVDDPQMKSQMDIVGRGFFAFSRATTMMLRRWGTSFWKNPAQARRYQLAAEAAVHSGVVYKDTNGDWMFHFPASGVAQEVLAHAMSHLPWFHDMAQFPSADFTGRVTSIIPGSDNPLQYNTNPIVSISGRSIAGLFPDYREWFDEVDRKLNGSQGQGQSWLATLEPSLVKKFTDVMSNDKDSITTSAMIGSLYDLYAAGLVPKDGASPAEQEDFIGRLKTQTKSKLFLRAVFGAISPATISVPDGGFKPADAAFAATGAQGLRDEYKQILNDTGGDFARSNAIWTALHPDWTVYTQSATESTTKGVLLPSTETAYSWMAKNTGFISKYKDVAAFFIPQPKAGEPFSMSAYRAQLEEGLRQRKTPDEFLNDVRVASAAGDYYQMEDQYNADLARAKAAGDDQLASQHRADWSAWSKAYKAAHPAFAQSVEASAANIVKAQGQMADLRDMLKHGNVPGSAKVHDALLGMVQAYDGYVAFRNSNPGSTNVAEAARSAALQEFQDYLTAVTKWAPEIEPLYTGVFRPLSGYALDPINN